MSNRADLVGALSTVRFEWRGEQITLRPHEDVQDKPSPFDAWLEWRADERGYEPKYLQTTWWVTVVLPDAKAESWLAALDTVRWEVRVALQQLGRHVGRAEPITITDHDHSYRLPGIRYTLTTTVLKPAPPRPYPPDQ